MKNVTILSLADALARSSSGLPEEDLMNLAGMDNFNDANMMLTIDSVNAFNCQMLSTTKGIWHSRTVSGDDPEAITEVPALNSFLSRHGTSALLSEKGLVLLHGYFCALSGMHSNCLTFSDVLAACDMYTKQPREAAKSDYFKLMRRFFISMGSKASETKHETANIIHTSQPELFASNFIQYAGGNNAKSSFLSLRKYV